MVSYRVMLDVPRELILFVSGLLAAHRREIGTRKGTRRLGCYRQALYALAWFRDKGDIPRLGRGFGLLAARAPGLQDALERALAEGTPYLILDGKVVDADRCREKTLSRKGKVIDLWYAGKTHDFGGNIQALFYPSGVPLWVSDVLPNNVHDLAAARENVLGVLRPFLDAMPVLADSGYEGAGHGVHVPVKKAAGVKELDIGTRARNALIRSVRCLGERGFALLTPAVENAPACHRQPGQNRPHRPRRACPSAIRTQDDHVKVAEKTSLKPSQARALTSADNRPMTLLLIRDGGAITALRERRTSTVPLQNPKRKSRLRPGCEPRDESCRVRPNCSPYQKRSPFSG